MPPTADKGKEKIMFEGVKLVGKFDPAKWFAMEARILSERFGVEVTQEIVGKISDDESSNVKSKTHVAAKSEKAG